MKKKLQNLALAMSLIAGGTAEAGENSDLIDLEFGVFAGRERNDLVGFARPYYQRKLNSAIGEYAQLNMRYSDKHKHQYLFYRFDVEFTNITDTEWNSFSTIAGVEYGDRFFVNAGVGFDGKRNLIGGRSVVMGTFGVDLEKVNVRVGADVNLPMYSDEDARTYWTPQIMLGIPVSLYPKSMETFNPSYEGDEKEYQRVIKKMSKHADLRQWTTIEDDYQYLLGLDVELEAEAYEFGGKSALYLGDLETAIRRFELAGTEKANSQILEIKNDFAEVMLNIDKKKHTIDFEILSGSLSSVERASIMFAKKALSEDGRFDGLLPLGKYNLNGQIFAISSSDAKVEIEIK